LGRRGAGRGRVAFTAPPQFPDLHDDWPLQRAALAAVGLDAEARVWSDPLVDWASFDVVVANGVWDHTRHPAEFLAWVDALQTRHVRLVNSAPVLRWNMDKHYLGDLAHDGVPVVPTTWVEPPAAPGPAAGGDAPAPPDLSDVTGFAGTDIEIVVKPSVSGGGHRTARYQPDEHDAAGAHVAALLAAGCTAMVQPYQTSVDERGETGLVFLGGEFSHAIHKEPMIRRGAGPQEDLIANQVVTAGSASADHLELAGAALRAAARRAGPATYARVDLVEGADGRPALLELELVDPVLFLTTAPAAAARLAAVLRDLARPPAEDA
jgi:hypothetical protein